MRNDRQIAVVAGDATWDWNLARREWPWPSRDDEMRAYLNLTGAYLLGRLIKGVAEDIPELLVYTLGEPSSSMEGNRFYASFQQYPSGTSERETTWRIKEFLGLQRGPLDTAPEAQPRLIEDPKNASLVLLDDMNLGFRDDATRWPTAISADGAKPWVVLKMAHPVTEGQLWTTLVEKHADRLIVVVPIDELRLSGAFVSRSISWERSAQDVAHELVQNAAINALAYCSSVVVLFGAVGAVLFTRENRRLAKHAVTLFFDPWRMEDTWHQLVPGHLYGRTHTMTAAIGRELLRTRVAPHRRGHSLDLAGGVMSGLAAIRRLYAVGFGPKIESESPKSIVGFPSDLAFPIKEVAEEILRVRDPVPRSEIFSAVKVRPDSSWTILHDHQAEDSYSLAARITTYGLKKQLTDVPVAEFGALTTVDRDEIESFRSIQALVSEYYNSGDPKPLSIAVFGPPGSGKSFGVTEVAKALGPEKIEICEFNLSQFDSHDDLVDAFIQVGGIGLRGKTPLVFWDEFDSMLGQHDLGWLRHFLAPMQDGRFQMGQVTRPIGKAILVFAGGTYNTMAQFWPTAGDSRDTPSGSKRMTEDQERAAKLPDFVSRLRGYVNIRGIDPDPHGHEDPTGTGLLVRRAIVLRSVIYRRGRHCFEEMATPQEGRLRIDEGVLRAFLLVKKYQHGVRSMDSIVAMSRLSGQSRFAVSSLPSKAQLDLHVDGDDFLRHLQDVAWYQNKLEQLAARVHTEFCKLIEASGDHHPAAGRQYEELLEDERDMNRLFIRDLSDQLNGLGYSIVRAGGHQRNAPLDSNEVERLARAIHERYVSAREAAGYTFGEDFDIERRTDPQLLHWNESAEKRKRQVVHLVHAIPQILKEANCQLVRASKRRWSRQGPTGKRKTIDDRRISTKRPAPHRLSS